MLREKDYCDYDTCVVLREIGCRIETEWYIHQPSYERGSCYLCFGIPRETSVLDECDYIPRLSLYEAQKWLREEKKIDVFVRAGYLGKNRVRHYFVEVFTSKDVITLDNDREDFDSYEEALSEGIKEAVKILKENETIHE